MAKILIVDDNEMNMRLFSDLLKTRGYQILECLDGTKALAVAKAEKPDLILMDIQMPEISGIEVTAKIRQTPGINRTPIIAISAFGDSDNILAAGMDAFISKPINIPSFFNTVSETLRSHQR